MIDIEKSLAYLNPELAAEWHPTKNGDLTPSNVYANSNKKAWCLGKCGHEWESVISTRNNGFKCPICNNKKVLKGFNDLATTTPNLALEWHPTKNGGLTPYDVTSGSDKKVWWLGECGHEWEQRIANRYHGNGCPFCKREKISKKVSDYHIKNNGSLAVTNPSLCQEWNFKRNNDLNPENLTANSNEIVWWIGKCGHEWKASISNRNKGTNCPYCSNQKVLTGFNDLATKYPGIAEEWHPTLNGNLSSNSILATSNKEAFWRGKCGHEWKQSVSKRTVRGQGCPICGKRLQTSYPEQATYYYIKQIYDDALNSYTELFNNQMELDIYIPSTKTGIEYDGVFWHSSIKTLTNSQEKYKICKEANVKLIRIKEIDPSISSSIPENKDCDFLIIIQRHPSKDELANTIKKVLNELGHYSCKIDLENDDAKIRDQYMGLLSDNSFAVKYPELLKEWNYDKNGGLSPYSLTESSGVYVWWKCSECGYEWKQRVAARTRGSGCKLCGNRRRSQKRIANWIQKRGSLSDINPSLSSEWHPTKNGELSPDSVMTGSGKKVWWKCKKCGYEWQATILSRSQGRECPVCARKEQMDVKQR